jgi:hypothetical protein
VGLREIKRENACHNLLSQPDARFFVFTRRLVSVLNSTTWFMVWLYTLSGLWCRGKKERNIF